MRETRDTMADRRSNDQAGYVLLAVTVFSFVVVIGGMALITMTSSENKIASYEQDAMEAFYLADSAIERSRARLLRERGWRDGWANVSFGNGSYDLSIADTTLSGNDNDVIRLSATGRVELAQRRIEVLAEIPPAGLGLAVLVGEDCIGFRRFCVNGRAHVNGWAYFGWRDRFFSCGEYTTDFDITPPPMFTEPDQYSDATYYMVRGTRIGGVPQARIYDRDGNDITTALGDSLTGVTGYTAWGPSFFFNFYNRHLIDRYFNETTGVFRREAGDDAVVVNFGGTPVGVPNPQNSRANLYFFGQQHHSVIRTTIINSRFTGLTEQQRTDPRYWRGGYSMFYRVRLQPRNGLALVSHNLYTGLQTRLGSDDWPALVYATGPLSNSLGRFWMTGTLITLGDYFTFGNSTFTYNEGFLERIPDAIVQQWPGLISGTMNILSWRELANNSN